MSHKRVTKNKSVKRKPSTKKRENITKKIPTNKQLLKIVFDSKDAGSFTKADKALVVLKTKKLSKNDIENFVRVMSTYVGRALHGIDDGNYGEIELGLYRAEIVAELLRDNARKHGNALSGYVDTYESEAFTNARALIGSGFAYLDDPDDWGLIEGNLEDAMKGIPDEYVYEDYIPDSVLLAGKEDYEKYEEQKRERHFYGL